MQSELTNKRRVFVSTELAGRRETRFALQVVLVSFAFFLAAAPFAKTQKRNSRRCRLSFRFTNRRWWSAI